MHDIIHESPEIFFYAGDEEWEADYDQDTITLSNSCHEVIIIDLEHRTVLKSSKIEPAITFEELFMIQDVLIEGEIE